MAEIKNNFISSRMNQDIDDRLMPNNEYRYALNLEVNRSEASDVGTLQNILGNSLAVDFRAIAGVNDLECIGVYVDESNNNIYVFLTDYAGSDYDSEANNYIYVYNTKQDITPNLNPCLLVTGPFLNFSMQSPIYGINLIENLLFWTDNRNQPRKINVNLANEFKIPIPTYYSTEEQISVAKLCPLKAPGLYAESDKAPGEYETTMYDVVSEFLPDGTTPNPYYQENYTGDAAYLEGRYVRFSYRYKFEDGEYSIMAPFTQIAYIPKQDGFFLYNASSPAINDEESAYRSTIVSFMQNKVNDILLQIEMPLLPAPVIIPPATVGQFVPCPANEIYSTYKIVEIEILYKEADGIAVSAVDSIPTKPDVSKGPGYFWNTPAAVYVYDYPSKKPFKTLPNRDVIRVNDIVPVKALSQEVVGNRIVYGNYQDKFTYPKYLDYNAGASEKLPFGFGEGEGTSVIEYPNHSVKENRNYQIGVILGDKFGRESGVILSDKIESGNNAFGASSLYLPYTGEGEIMPYSWFGNSLKILFNQSIQPKEPNTVTGWPGLYNGDKSSAEYNPLGWYSYKIVVKQTEQDYYNVYLPGVMAAYPDNATLELGKTSHAVLLNDNINKVPRDLAEVGPGQKQFRSSVILFPRVNNNTTTYDNQQYYPGNEYAFVSTIATNNSLFYPNGVSPTTPPAGFENFYQIDSDPLIARISTPEELGVVTTSPNNVINLAVYETKPIESRLDIYWETSTSGLISELNTAIQAGSDSSVDSYSGWSFDLSEADGPGTTVTTPIVFKDILGDEIMPTSVVLQSVLTGTGINVTSKFVLEQIGSTNEYTVKTAPGAYFYYGYNASTANRYYFQIQATVGSPSVSNSFVMQGYLSNVLPTITNKPIATINKTIGAINVYDFNAVNGSNPSGGNSTSDLSWTVTGDPIFTITNTGLLQDLSGLAEGTFNLRVTVTEASGATDFVDITVVYPLRNNVTFTSWSSKCGTVSAIETTTGFITITGSDATFYAFANVNTGTVSITTDVTINGVSLNAFRNTSGTTQSSPLTLSPGTYPYFIEVDRVITGSGNGCGGINYIQ
jgi:hypothetical protein